MPPKSKENKVDVYHLTVGQGDSQLVCWYTHDSNSDKNTLQKIVLIDGGPHQSTSQSKADRGSKHEISLFLLQLADSFETWDGGPPKLDAIVISHWDTDHWEGIADMLQYDLDNQWFDGPNKSKVPTHISFCRYDKTSRRPLTVLYIPYMDNERKFGEKDQQIPFVFNVAAKGDTVNFLWKDPDTPRRFVRIPSICKVRSDWRQTLGCNLFQNERPLVCAKSGEPKGSNPFANLAELLKSHSKSGVNDYKQRLIGVEETEPALLIVRAHRIGYGGQPASKKDADPVGISQGYDKGNVDTDIGGSERQAEEPSTDSLNNRSISTHVLGLHYGSSFPPMFDGRISLFPYKVSLNSKAYAKNSASICCVLVWRTNSNTGFRLSHYLGGDMTWDQEAVTAEWLSRKVKTTDPDVEIDCLKLSHHGAINSTPYALIDKLKPKSIVFSAGVAPKYSHPAFELLIWLQIWALSFNAQLKRKEAKERSRTGFVYGTMLPFYLVQDNRKYILNSKLNITRWKKVNINHSGPLPRYQQALRDMWRKTKQKGLHALDRFIEDISKGRPPRRAKKLAMITEDANQAWRKVAGVGCLKYATKSRNPGLSRFLSSSAENVYGCDYICVTSDAAEGESPKVVFLSKKKVTKKKRGQLSDTQDKFSKKRKYAETSTDASLLQQPPDWKRVKKDDLSIPNIGHNIMYNVDLGQRFLKAVAEGQQDDCQDIYGFERDPDLHEEDVDPDDEPDRDDSNDPPDPEDSDVEDNSDNLVHGQLGPSGAPVSDQPRTNSILSVFERTILSWTALASDVFKRVTTYLKQRTGRIHHSFVRHVVGLHPRLRIWPYFRQYSKTNILACSDYKPQWIPDKFTGDIRSPDEELDDFLSLLDMGYMHLDRQLTLGSAELLGAPGDVIKDGLYAWLAMVLGTSRVRFTRADPQQAWSNVEMFIPVSCLGDRNSVRSDLVFSVEALLGVCPRDTIPESGYIATAATLVLALAAPQDPITTTLGEICEWLGLGESPWLLLSPKLTLDRKARNIIWFTPSQRYLTVIRLEFLVDTSALQEFLLECGIKTITIENARYVIKTGAEKYPTADGLISEQSDYHVFRFDIKAGIQYKGLNTILEVEDGLMTLTFRPSDGEASLDECVDFVIGLLGLQRDQLDFERLRSLVPDWTTQVRLTLFRVRIDTTEEEPQIADLELDLAVRTNRQTESGLKVVFLVTVNYDWASHIAQFSGRLAVPLGVIIPPPIPQALDPLWEEHRDPFDPYAAVKGSALAITIKDVFPDLGLIMPEGVNPVLNRLQMEISSEGAVNLFCTLLGNDDKKEASGDGNRGRPYLKFSSLGFSASFVPKSADRSATYAFALATGIFLVGSKPEFNALLSARIEYTKLGSNAYASVRPRVESASEAAWSLSADIRDLSFGTFAGFFPEEDQSAAMAVLEHIVVRFMAIQYQYAPGGKSSHFEFDGAMLIDQVELHLKFERPHQRTRTTRAPADMLTFREDPDSWFFSAQLSPEPGSFEEVTLKSMLQSLIGSDDLSSTLPDFADLTIMSDQLNPSSGSKIDLVVERLQSKSGKTFVVFVLQVKIVGTVTMSFTFGQLIEKAPKSVKPEDAPPVKRILRVEIDSLPWSEIPSLPVVGKLRAPFTELSYLLVTDGANEGITAEEMAVFNDIDILKDDPFRFGATKDEAIAMVVGSHLMVIDDGGGSAADSILLDYVFGRKEKKKRSNDKALKATDPPAPVDGKASGMVKLQKTQGPLTINNMGLSAQKNVIKILFDAYVKLGPLSFTLIGFEISINFEGTHSIGDINKDMFSCKIKGMGASLNQPPIKIGGLFIDLSELPTKIKYVGGLIVGFVPWTFIAAGGYAQVTKGNDIYKSVFIMAILAGPLFELGYAQINDVTVGLGYNSNLRLPAVSEVNEFPFIALGGSVNSDPLETMSTLSDGPGAWIREQEGPMWIAAGLGARAFQALNVKAVVVIETNPYVVLAVYARAQVILPPVRPAQPLSPARAFVYADLSIASSVDFHAGTMTFQASLNASSFILNEACHLTVGDGVAINGSAYFAINPKMCMAGMQLNATLEAGRLSAWFHASADFLLVFDPLYFTAGIRIAVGVQFSYHKWFITIHISVDICAGLDLWGPPFGGNVYVDFWLLGFSISFGKGRLPLPGIDIDRFYQLLLQQNGSENSSKAILHPSAVLASAGVASSVGNQSDLKIDSAESLKDEELAHILLAKDGLLEPDGKSAKTDVPPSAPWRARNHGFSFIIQAKFAISTVKIAVSVPSEDQRILDRQHLEPPTKFYAKPMHLRANPDESLGSVMTVKVTNAAGEAMSEFTCDGLVKAVPSALWGSYDAAEDPTTGSTRLLESNANQTLDLVMGLECFAPLASGAPDTLLPFNADAAMTVDVVTPSPILPGTITYSNSDFDPDTRRGEVNRKKDLKDLQDIWHDAVAGHLLENAVSAWSSAMGWADEFEGTTQPEYFQQDLNQAYLAVPFISVR